MLFVYGLLTATVAIIVAEIVFDYSLGDLLKDFSLRIFKGAEGLAVAQVKRVEARAAKIKAAL